MRRHRNQEEVEHQLNDDDDPFLNDPGLWLRVCQVLILLGIGCGAIYFQESNDYEINPLIIAAWSFMGAYGFTLAVLRIREWRWSKRRPTRALTRQQETDHTF